MTHKTKKKWGKVGAPKSAKRKAWLRRMRSARKTFVLTKKGKKKKSTRRGIVLKRKVSGKKPKQKRFAKGSKAAKAFMKKLRSKRG